MIHMNPKNESPLNTAIAAQLRAERAIKNVTYDELAKRTGLAKSAVSNYLGGHRAIPIPNLEILAHALGTTALDIVRAASERMGKE